MQIPIEAKIAKAHQRIHLAIKTYQPIASFALFSGGHDSLSASLVAMSSGLITSCFHINTGIGVPATHDFVVKTCQARGWKLIEKHAKDNKRADGTPDPQIFEDLVMAYGFPGPAHHGKMYNRLKQRALEMLERESGANCRGKKKLRVLYISGCRSQESVRRMGHVEELQLDGRRIWCAPIHDWTKLDTTLCLDYFHAPRNPVVDLIHKSGECLCGAFARQEKSHEMEELALWDLTRPAYDEIQRLNALVRPIHGWGWGEKPLKRQRCNSEPGMLCQGCKVNG